MKHLTLGVLIAFAVLLTWKISLTSTYYEVKQDLQRSGYHFPKLWYEHIGFFNAKDNFYGVNVSMGSHASNITILINYHAWVKMNKTQRKILILHELVHSIGSDGNQYHCNDYGCIMRPQSIEKWRNADYEQVLKNTMLHHNLYSERIILPFRF